MGTVKIVFGSLFVCCAIASSCGEPVSAGQETEEVFVSKLIRVKRQAGYVYDRPSVSFELPTRAPTVATQAPTAVDRTQAQMMYYAYPVPAAPGPSAGGDIASSGGNAGASAGSSSTTSADASGYNYAPQNTASASAGAQSTSITASSQTSAGSAQTSNSASGYNYNTPSGGSGSNSGYQSTQTTNTGSTQGSSSAGSSQGSSASGSAGYNYDVPKQPLPGPRLEPTVEVSTSAPKYLPPPGDGGSSTGVAVGSTSGGVDTGGAVSTGSGASPPLDQYLPPLTQPNSPAPVPSNRPFPNLGSGVSTSYIPPNRAPSPSPINDATPRPFSPAPPPTGYLPPNVNSEIPSQNSPSTPASTYLPPVI